MRLTKKLILFLLLLTSLTALAEERTFYTLNTRNGLSDNHVLQMIQLHDGRMLIATRLGIDIYDGQGFSSMTRENDDWTAITGYKGFTHLYVDKEQRLWLKEWGKVCCKDLRTMTGITHPMEIFRNEGINDSIYDIYVDSDEEIWLVTKRGLINESTQNCLDINGYGTIQDVDTYNGKTYVFFNTGTTAIYGTKSSKPETIVKAYDDSQISRFDCTSLVVKGLEGNFYQVRMGKKESILQCLDTKENKFKKIYECPYSLHTFIITPNNILYATSPYGYFKFDLNTGDAPQRLTSLQLPDGTSLSTGINTVCQDKTGGIWLGTYNSGLLYTSPLSGLFDTQPISIDISPILTNIFLHGQALQTGKEYDGKVLLSTTPPYSEELEFKHDQNALAFQFTTMNYVRPRETFYKYRLNNEQWHEVSADSAGNIVDDKGILYLSFINLPHGEYILSVTASTTPHKFNGPVRTIKFTVAPPWWVTPWAIALYLLSAILAIYLAFKAYSKSIRQKLEQQKREEMLMMRVHDLIDKCNQLESSMNVVLTEENDTKSEPELNQQEMEFMNKATALVESHLSDSRYGVEQLANDLCMERTGLYKRLTAIMDKSPVAFIRNIRLHRAAEMLKERKHTISEISEMTGFCTPSYFSKCFQKEFGCKPMEYSQKEQ